MIGRACECSDRYSHIKKYKKCYSKKITPQPTQLPTPFPTVPQYPNIPFPTPVPVDFVIEPDTQSNVRIKLNFGADSYIPNKKQQEIIDDVLSFLSCVVRGIKGSDEILNVEILVSIIPIDFTAPEFFADYDGRSFVEDMVSVDGAFYPLSGIIEISDIYFVGSETDDLDKSNDLPNVLMHHILHILGIGNLWNVNVSRRYVDELVPEKPFYPSSLEYFSTPITSASSALVAEYNRVFKVNSEVVPIEPIYVRHLPIESQFVEKSDRILYLPGIVSEISNNMAGDIIDAVNTIFSRFTATALEDLGYDVNYSKVRNYSLICLESTVNLSIGIKTFFNTYSEYYILSQLCTEEYNALTDNVDDDGSLIDPDLDDKLLSDIEKKLGISNIFDLQRTFYFNDRDVLDVQSITEGRTYTFINEDFTEFPFSIGTGVNGPIYNNGVSGNGTRKIVLTVTKDTPDNLYCYSNKDGQPFMGCMLLKRGACEDRVPVGQLGEDLQKNFLDCFISGRC